MVLLNKPIEEALLACGISFERSVDGSFRIPGKSTDVGDLLLSSEDAGVTVYVGNLTHAHFSSYPGDEFNAEYTRADCVRDAVVLVRGIIEERWLIWVYPNGAGGCYEIGTESEFDSDVPLPDSGAVLFKWSGRVPGAV